MRRFAPVKFSGSRCSPGSFFGNIVAGALAPFLAQVVFLAAFGLDGATRGFRAAVWAFLGGSGPSAAAAVAWAVSFSVVDVVISGSKTGGRGDPFGNPGTP